MCKRHSTEKRGFEPLTTPFTQMLGLDGGLSKQHFSGVVAGGLVHF